MPIIEVEHLTKEYRLGQLQSLRTTAMNQIRRLTGQPLERRALFKALDDVSFTIDEGEVVGIIGHNGAGKSTLLKLLAKITNPTSGTARVRGRIAPLIEVGAGFVPELTGRENVYLNGSILGMSRKAIDRKFEEIVDFAEIPEFIDTPVKRYSSGMLVKLAFSVATSIESEILIVDEVLAVGDLAFQRKCFDRMESLIKKEKKTVLVVSHNIRQIERLTARVLLLERGQIGADGLPKDVCELFYSRSNEKIALQAAETFRGGRNILSSGEVELSSLTLINEAGEPSTKLLSGDPLTVRGEFQSMVDIPHVEIMYGIHTTDMVYIATMGTAHLEKRATIHVGKNLVDCEIPSLPLVPGTYALRVGVLDQLRRQLFYGETLKVFTVEPKDIPVTKMSALGLVSIPARWEFTSDHDLTDGQKLAGSAKWAKA